MELPAAHGIGLRATLASMDGIQFFPGLFALCFLTYWSLLEAGATWECLQALVDRYLADGPTADYSDLPAAKLNPGMYTFWPYALNTFLEPVSWQLDIPDGCYWGPTPPEGLAYFVRPPLDTPPFPVWDWAFPPRE